MHAFANQLEDKLYAAEPRFARGSDAPRSYLLGAGALAPFALLLQKSELNRAPDPFSERKANGASTAIIPNCLRFIMFDNLFRFCHELCCHPPLSLAAQVEPMRKSGPKEAIDRPFCRPLINWWAAWLQSQLCRDA